MKSQSTAIMASLALFSGSVISANALPEYHIINQQYHNGVDSSLLFGTPSDTTPRNQALLLTTPQSGQGTLFAAIDRIKDKPAISGTEILAVSQNTARHTGFLLQLPDNFNQRDICILAVPMTGSARLYNAYDMQLHGLWGLKKGCAVVYTDKSQGNAMEDLATGRNFTLDGRMLTAKEINADTPFVTPMTAQQRKTYNQKYPDRITFRHANSRLNTDATWGEDIIASIHFAFSEISKKYAISVDKTNTTVLVYGSSNGGGASLKAGEADSEGLIDGIVAVEPQIQPQNDRWVVIHTQTRTLHDSARSLIDYFTSAILYQPCAALAVKNAPLADKVQFAAERCASLYDKGFLTTETTEQQAQESLDKLHQLGWTASTSSDIQQPMHFLVAPSATLVKYINAQGKFGAEENICGYSVAATDKQGKPVALNDEQWQKLWLIASGGAPAGNVQLINNNAPGGALRDDLSRSASTGRQDYNLDGVLCLRELGRSHSPQAEAVRKGIAEIRASGELHGIPTIIVHGRDDVRVPVNFSSRPYVALNSLREGASSRLRYIEVENAGHFGAEAPFDNQLIPLDYYGEKAIDMLWHTLKQGARLPESQIIRARSRGERNGVVPELSKANLPDIQPQAAPDNRISVNQGQVTIPGI